MSTISRSSSGFSTGARICRAICSGAGLGCWTSTGIGFCTVPSGALLAGFGVTALPSLAWCIPRPRRFTSPSTRLVAKLWTVLTFFSIEEAYRGRSEARLATCTPITLPSERIMAIASTTASSTASTRGTWMWRRRFTTGDSTKVRSTASVIGMSTSRAK